MEFATEMSFHFRVTKSWENDRLGVYHLIGVLLNGKILPNTVALVDGGIGKVRIKSVSIVDFRGEKPDPNEFTLSISKPSFELKQLEGKTLVSVKGQP